MRKNRLLRRGGDILLPVLPRRWRWGLGHLGVNRRVLIGSARVRAPGSITLLVGRLLLPVWIMGRISSIRRGLRGCIVFHGLRWVHRVTVRLRRVLLLISVADRSAVGATAGSTVVPIFVGRWTCGTRTACGEGFHGTNRRIHGAFDEATNDGVAAGAVLKQSQPGE